MKVYKGIWKILEKSTSLSPPSHPVSPPYLPSSPLPPPSPLSLRPLTFPPLPLPPPRLPSPTQICFLAYRLICSERNHHQGWGREKGAGGGRQGRGREAGRAAGALEKLVTGPETILLTQANFRTQT